LFVAKQEQLAAKDWLQELEATNALPVVLREWRLITLNAARRTRLKVPKQTNL
jgi:hypothetical protein